MDDATQDEAIAGYREAREGVAIEPPAPRGLVRLTGRDAVPFLHNILTNDIASLRPGDACYAAWLTPQGRMLTDMHVLRGADDVRLDVEPPQGAMVARKIDESLFAEQIAIEDRSPATWAIHLHGPQARKALARMLSAGNQQLILELPPMHHASLEIDDADLTALAGTWYGVAGIRVSASRTAVDALQAALIDAGAARLGLNAANALRIEAGTPLFGVDMTTDTIPLEAGIERHAISMTKGCYVGQEVIVRILHRGHGRVARRLIGVVVEGDRPPDPGTQLFDGDRLVGSITSTAYSPGAGSAIALAYVRRDDAEAGQMVRVGSTDARAARITMLPF